MSGIFQSSDLTAERVVHAPQLAGDELRLSTAKPDQLTAPAAFLAKALARFPDGVSCDPRRADAIGRLETAGKAIGAELRRRGRSFRSPFIVAVRLRARGDDDLDVHWCSSNSRAPSRPRIAEAIR
jgi:hypothetical protein